MWKALQKQLVIAGDAPGKTCTFRCDHVLPGGLGGTVTVLMGLEGVPDLSSVPKDEAGLTRKFET